MNTLFLLAMILEGLFALGFIAIPKLLMNQLGVTIDVPATLFARMLGTALLSFPVLLWYGRRSDKAEFRTAIARGLFVYYLTSAILLTRAMTAGLLNALGWGIVILHLVFLVWFGAYAFRKN